MQSNGSIVGPFDIIFLQKQLLTPAQWDIVFEHLVMKVKM